MRSFLPRIWRLRLRRTAFAALVVGTTAAVAFMLWQMLRANGLSVETRTLPDHARFTPKLAGAGRGKPVLLTEKDAVKCNGVGWSEAGWVEVAPVVEGAPASRLLERIAQLASPGRTPGHERTAD